MHRGFGGLTGILMVAMLWLATAAASAQNSQDAAEINALGVASYERQEWAAATTHFDAALQLEPDNAVVRRNLTNSLQAHASLLAGKGDYKNAIYKLRQAVQNDPENAMPLMQLGAYYLHEGDVREAIFRLEEAIELSPNDIDAHYLLGEAYYRDNDVTSALEQWDWVERVDPDREGLAERLEIARRDHKVEANYSDKTSQHFNVTYSRETEGRLVRDVVTILESAYRDVGKALQSFPPTPVQVSLYTSEGFMEATMMKDHIGAVYDGTKIRCPVIGPDGNPLPAEEMRRRLRHEYVHVVVRHVARDGVPWWFNEGIAESLTLDLSDNDRAFLRRASDESALFHLQDLTEGQLDRLNKDELILAYKQAHATVEYLKTRYGTRRLAHYLDEIAKGTDPGIALRRVFRLSYETLQMAMIEHIQ